MYTNSKFEKIYSSYSYKIYQLFVLVMNINCGMNSIDNVYVNNLKNKFSANLFDWDVCVFQPRWSVSKCFRLIQLGYSSRIRIFINWLSINSAVILKRYYSFPQTPGTFPDLLLLVLRPCGPIVLDRLRNAYREIPFLK